MAIASAAFICMMTASCGGRQSSSATETVALSATRAFPAVEVPGIYEGDEALEYFTMHFWDAFGDTSKAWLCDSTHVHGVPRADLEQAFSNYAYALDMLPFEMARKCLRQMYSTLSGLREGTGASEDNASLSEGTAAGAFEGTMEIAEKYLYDPNSPVRNEDYWHVIAAALAEDPQTPEDLRLSYAFQAQVTDLNRTGTKAADFIFCDANGKMHRLYEVRADYTLLFFSNPGCTACKEIIDRLSSSPKVDWLISEGHLAVVNVYIDDELDAWREYMPIYPENWHNGYDPSFEIRSSLLYNVRAIPSVYILGADKTVILKDAPEGKAFNFIENI